MEEPSTTTISEETSPGMEDREVEELLDQATSLTTEIVEDAGEDEKVETDVGSAQNEPVPEPPQGEVEPPDVEEALRRTEDGVKELNDLLNDPDGGDAADSGAQDEISAPTMDSAGARAAGESAVPNETDHEPEDESQEEKGEAELVPKQKRSILRSAKAIGVGTVRAAITTPIMTVNSFLRVWIFLDRPFAKVPIGIKRALGIVALATLLAAVAAWVLPMLLSQNPFENMER